MSIDHYEEVKSTHWRCISGPQDDGTELEVALGPSHRVLRVTEQQPLVDKGVVGLLPHHSDVHLINTKAESGGPTC